MDDFGASEQGLSWKDRNREKLRQYNREWYWKNVDHARQTNKNWREKNKERKKLTSKLWREKNRNRQIEKCREWREKNPEKVKEQNKKYYCKNYYYSIQRSRAWYKANPDRSKQRTKTYIKNRLKYDAVFRLRHYTRCRVNNGLREKKEEFLEQFLGYSIDELKKHLESKFSDGMNWENYGRITKENSHVWNIDHIKPLSKIVKEGTIEELKEAYRLENLQPMWAMDNIKKGGVRNVCKSTETN